jgi:RNA polymerase sigma factor (sigma-70 family)
VLAEIFERHTGAVQRILQRLRIPPRDLADVAQDAWVAIWRALERLDGASPSEPEKLATTIAYRKGANHLKARERRPEQALSPAGPEPADESPSSEHQIMQREEEHQARALVLSLLGELTLNERRVVVLADFEPHHSMSEIAEELDISEEAAHSRHRRAHERMRHSLSHKKRAHLAAIPLLPGVAVLELEQLLAIEAPAPPLPSAERAVLWSRVTAAIGGKALAAGGGAVAAMLTTKQAAAALLLAFFLGGVTDEALRGSLAPAPTAFAAEATPVLPTADVPEAPRPTAEPTVRVAAPPVSPALPAATNTHDAHAEEWQAIRDARALLRGKHPSPEAALEALKRVHSPGLRALRDRLQAEAEALRPPRPETGSTTAR